MNKWKKRTVFKNHSIQSSVYKLRMNSHSRFLNAFKGQISKILLKKVDICCMFETEPSET